MALNCTIHVGLVARLLNQLVVETLVIALKVVMLRVFFHDFPKVVLAQRDDLIETLGSDGENESLRVGIQVGAARRELQDFGSRLFGNL